MLEQPSTNNRNARPVEIEAEAMLLQGQLSVPENARGIVVVTSSSTTAQPGSLYDTILQNLEESLLATLRVNLLTQDEEQVDAETGYFRDNVDIFSQRIIGIANWLLENPHTQNLGIGYFGIGVTAAASLMAAANRPDPVHAVVACNTALELAKPYLSRVLAPTQLVVGAQDTAAVEANQNALKELPINLEVNKKVEIIERTGNIFNTPEAVQRVTAVTASWFAQHLEPIV